MKKSKLYLTIKIILTGATLMGLVSQLYALTIDDESDNDTVANNIADDAMAIDYTKEANNHE